MSKTAGGDDGRDRGEAARLTAVRRYEVLDAPHDDRLESVCSMLTRLFDVQMASITLVESDHVRIMASAGPRASQIALDAGLCALTVQCAGPNVVSDTLVDPRTARNALVHGTAGVRFYAGAPITTADGHRVGTVDVLGTEPRLVAEVEARMLEQLAALAADQLELRLANVQLERERQSHNEAFLRETFTQAPIAMAILDLDLRFEWVNEALCRMTGHSDEQLMGTSTAAITHPDDVVCDAGEVRRALEGTVTGYHIEKRLIDARGHVVWVSFHATLLRDSAGKPLRFLAQIQDVTGRRRYEQSLRHMADHDPLTGLLNRRAFERELAAHQTRVARYGPEGAAIVLDIDNFKAINDQLGHPAGDEILIAAARALRSRLRDSDILARLGGDEFAVILPKAGQNAASLVANELLDALRSQAIEIDGEPQALTASAGIALFSQAGETEALKSADMALYEAKRAGRDRAQLYIGNRHEAARPTARICWRERIERALAQDGFTLLAQPIVDLATRTTCQQELLLRMRDEHGRLVCPDAFMDTAEQAGIIGEIDRWVTTQAIGVLARRTAAANGRGAPVPLAVNLSALSIGSADLLATIARELERTSIDPGGLIFECSANSALADGARASHFASDLAALGCRLALEHFGGGYGSFAQLKQLTFEFLKIDAELVSGCRTDSADRLIVRAIADIASGMGRQTIAEHVRDDESASLMASLGVRYGQGYHLGMPAPLAC